MFQVKIGIRNMVMPGARSVRIVVIMLTPPRIVPRPDSASPMIHMSAPTPGEFVASESGVYAVQPKFAAPPGVTKPSTASVLPNAYSQYANEFSRGNDTSGAPICNGTTKLPNANTIGVAKNSSMIVPCIVNSWLYWSTEKICSSGRASSARISSAMKPPTKNQMNDVARYIRPISLASVVRSNRPIAEPFTARRTGYGRVTIGLGATVVTNGLLCARNCCFASVAE